MRSSRSPQTTEPRNCLTMSAEWAAPDYGLSPGFSRPPEMNFGRELRELLLLSPRTSGWALMPSISGLWAVDVGGRQSYAMPNLLMRLQVYGERGFAYADFAGSLRQ